MAEVYRARDTKLWRGQLLSCTVGNGVLLEALRTLCELCVLRGKVVCFDTQRVTFGS
jgi:hypothetical protein